MFIDELVEDIASLSEELRSLDPDDVTQRFDVERLLAFRRYCLSVQLDSLHGRTSERPESGRRLHGE